MTSTELHREKIVPLRFELQRLEKEYEKLFRKECGERIGETASCNNCAFSCVIAITDFHNMCARGRCTCCRDWCHAWIPENNVSKYIRENHHYDDDVYDRISGILGEQFLADCAKAEKENVAMEVLQFIKKFDEGTV